MLLFTNEAVVLGWLLWKAPASAFGLAVAVLLWLAWSALFGDLSRQLDAEREDSE